MRLSIIKVKDYGIGAIPPAFDCRITNDCGHIIYHDLDPRVVNCSAA